MHAPKPSRPMLQFDSFVAFQRAVAAGRLLRDDIVYVSSDMYARLTDAARGWLWNAALESRVRLITDLEVDPPIVVHRKAGGGDELGPGDALERR